MLRKRLNPFISAIVIAACLVVVAVVWLKYTAPQPLPAHLGPATVPSSPAPTAAPPGEHPRLPGARAGAGGRPIYIIAYLPNEDPSARATSHFLTDFAGAHKANVFLTLRDPVANKEDAQLAKKDNVPYAGIIINGSPTWKIGGRTITLLAQKGQTLPQADLRAVISAFQRNTLIPVAPPPTAPTTKTTPSSHSPT